MVKKTPRILVILNPNADRGHAREIAPKLKALLNLNRNVGWVETSRPGDAIQLATQACKEGYDIVVAAGGDGTAQEVVNGLMACYEDGARSALGLIPLGSGNDFAWMMGVVPGKRQPRDPRGLEQAIQRLTAGKTRVIDVGRVCEGDRCRYFCNGAGIGFDGVVNIESRKIAWARGFLMYALGVLRTMVLYYRAPHTVLELDDMRIEQPLMMISVANGRRFAGGFYVAPHAEVDDGYFDVCTVDKVSRPEMLALIPKFLNGTQVNNRHVRMARARRVTVQCDEGFAVHVDGEVFSTASRRLVLEIVPRKLRVVV
jgi:YegS/Rv2252/BmrU family lipid kinase